MAFVYTFTSSLDGLIFYVGKGQGNRIKSHFWAASSKRIRISRVDQRIREIWQQGGKVIVRKPYNGITDLEANCLEQSLIEQYGYIQLANQNWHICHKSQWCPPKGKRNGW